MQSIIPKESIYNCSRCAYLVSSSSSVCENCGLVEDFDKSRLYSEDEEMIYRTFDISNNLKSIAIVSIFFSILNLSFFIETQNIFWLNIPLWITYILFIFKYIKYKRNFNAIIMQKKDSEIIMQNENKALILIVISFVIGFGIYLF